MRKGADPVEMAVRMRIQQYDPTQEGKQAVQGEQAAQGNQAVLQGVKPGVESEQAVAGWKGNESGIEGVMKAAKEGECQTCEQRKYQDGSSGSIF